MNVVIVINILLVVVIVVVVVMVAVSVKRTEAIFEHYRIYIIESIIRRAHSKALSNSYFIIF